MRRPTRVKARDLLPGMVVGAGYFYGTARPQEATVKSVARAADLIEPARVAVSKAKTRAALRAAAEELLAAMDAVEDCGREARRVTFEEFPTPRTYLGSDDLPLVREGLRRT